MTSRRQTTSKSESSRIFASAPSRARERTWNSVLNVRTCAFTSGPRFLRGRSLRELGGEALRRADEPGLGDELLQLVGADPFKADEDGREAVEVRGREIDLRVVRDERLLGADVRHVGAEDRAAGRGVAQRGQVGPAERAVPH